MNGYKARAGWDIDLRDGEAREAAFVHTLLKPHVESVMAGFRALP